MIVENDFVFCYTKVTNYIIYTDRVVISHKCVLIKIEILIYFP